MDTPRDVIVPPEHHAALERLRDAFLDENTRINLSAHRTPEACWYGNIVDSLPLLPLLPGQRLSLLDVGSGGGFPALPLALCRPDCTITALDSTKKKMAAVERIAAACGITNLRTVGSRAEEAGQDAAHRERYDVVTARAVAALPTLLELTVPFAKVGGSIVLWKSVGSDLEQAGSAHAQAVLKIRLEAATRYVLPEPWGTRVLLRFTKLSPTLKAYPRATGLPGTKPL